MSTGFPFVIYGFATTHDALSAEKLLEAAGVEYVTIPTPRTLGALCGLALRVRSDDAGGADAAITAGGLAWTGRLDFEDRVRGDS